MKFSPQKVDFEIEYENGEKGIITFNPYDKKFYDNLEKLPDKIFKSIEKIDFRENANEFVSTGDKILSDISNGNITSVKELSSKEKKEILKLNDCFYKSERKIGEAIKQDINDVFGYDVSSIIFKYNDPMDIYASRIIGTDIRYVHAFLQGFMEDVEKYFFNEMSEMKKQVTKYV